MAELCHCGKPLHYLSKTTETMVRRLIASRGAMILVRFDGRDWLVHRHYIALHGLKSRELPALGFREVTGLAYWLSDAGDAITCGKCRQTSRNATDVAQRYCGHCHEFLDGVN